METNNNYNENKDKKIRILCLDGGGIRGLITAHILKEVEKQLHLFQKEKGEKETSLGDYFDMIAGTSTGSILAAGIATGIDIKDMIKIYQKEGIKIFPDYGKLGLFNIFKRFKLMWKHKKLSVPLYDNQGLIDILKRQDIFGEKILKEVGGYPEKKEDDYKPKAILLILAYDTLYRNTTFFTNYHTKEEFPNGEPWYYKKPLWQICTSSASAPTFFPGFELTHEERLCIGGEKMTSKDGKPIKAPWNFPHVDGGVTANNPSLCAIARALDLGYKLENISLLSIGTGTDTEPYEFKQIKGWGLVNWAHRIANVFMGGQAEVQARICRSLMGGSQSERYLRLQFDLNQTMYKEEDLKDKKIYNQLYKEVFGNKKVDYSEEEIREALKIYARKPRIPQNKWSLFKDKKQLKNQLINKHVDNKMDNAKEDNIKILDEVAEAFMKNNDEKVKKQIEDFIRKNPPEKSQFNIKEERLEISVC